MWYYPSLWKHYCPGLGRGHGAMRAMPWLCPRAKSVPRYRALPCSAERAARSQSAALSLPFARGAEPGPGGARRSEWNGRN